jgi:hypothetical protein
LGLCLRLNTTISVIDLSYTNCLFDEEIKNGVRDHPMLNKLDLRNTKSQEEDLKYIDNILVEKFVKKNLQKQ